MATPSSKCFAQTQGSVPLEALTEIVNANPDFTHVSQVSIDGGTARYILQREDNAEFRCICADCKQPFYHKGGLLKHYTDSYLEVQMKRIASWDETRQTFPTLSHAIPKATPPDVVPYTPTTTQYSERHMSPVTQTFCRATNGCPKSSDIQQFDIFQENPEFLDIIEVAVRKDMKRRYGLVRKGALDKSKHIETICLDCKVKFDNLAALFKHYLPEDEVKRMNPGKKHLKKFRSMQYKKKGQTTPQKTATTSNVEVLSTFSPEDPNVVPQHLMAPTTLSQVQNEGEEPRTNKLTIPPQHDIQTSMEEEPASMITKVLKRKIDDREDDMQSKDEQDEEREV